MTMPMLEVDGLEVRHGAVHAVRGLSLTVDRGEIVGLIGPNGAGKSSTLHAVMGLVRPAAGDVRLHGHSLVGRAPEDVARAGIALVPEGRRIFAQRAQRTVALADRSNVVSNGRLRLTLAPDAADDTEALVSAYLS